MTGRGAAALAALLVLGVVGGFVVADRVLGAPDSGGQARPVPASSPSLPLDPPPVVNPDPTNPPLARGLTLERQEVGSRFPVSVPVPVNWLRQDVGEGEATWKPRGYRNFTYIMRVQRVSSNGRSIPSAVENALEDLSLRYEDFTPLERSTNSLEVSYVFRGYRRYTYQRWFDLTGSGRAEVQLTLTGRERDTLGMQQLFDRVSEGIEAGTP